MLSVLLALACQPGPPVLPEEPACDGSVPGAGEVRVQAWCDDLDMTDGEARNGDVWVGNSALRVGFKHPLTALSVPGLGGGTIVDVAPWDFRDRVHELVPIVDDGWLIVDAFTAHDDGRVEVSGIVAALPDRPAANPGARRTVTWTVSPDSPWIGLEGADGLWVHPHGDFRLLDGQVVQDSLTVGHDGEVVDDLGGAVRIAGVTRVLVAPTRDASLYLYEDGVEVSGTTDAAALRVVALVGDEVVAQLGVDGEGGFAGRVPAGVQTVRAEGPPALPSVEVVPAPDLELPLGATATLELELAFDGPPARPARLAWADAAGQTGVARVPPGGGPIALPAGPVDVELTAGPLSVPWTAHLELDPDVPTALSVTVDGVDPGQRVLADVARRVSRSRTWRGLDEDAVRAAVLDGAAFVVGTAEDDLTDPITYEDDDAFVRVRSGSTLTHPDGWWITSWPWSDVDDEGGHGALQPAFLPDAATALYAAWGGPSEQRFVVVDLPFLGALGPPWAIDADPAMVLLDAPGPDGPTGGAWDAWFAWLDARVALVPVGPWTWADVADRDVVSGVDVEAALLRGRVCATTGPLVTLDVGGVRSGDVRPDDGTPAIAVVTVVDPRDELTHTALIGPGGELVASSTADGLITEVSGADRWLVGVAWSDDGAAFAVTGPVWSGPAPADTGDTADTAAPSSDSSEQ